VIKFKNQAASLKLPYDDRNFITLCGREGILDTCHHGFDAGAIAMFQTSEKGASPCKFVLGAVDPYGRLHGRQVVYENEANGPYRQAVHLHACWSLANHEIPNPFGNQNIVDWLAQQKTPPSKQSAEDDVVDGEATSQPAELFQESSTAVLVWVKLHSEGRAFKVGGNDIDDLKKAVKVEMAEVLVGTPAPMLHVYGMIDGKEVEITETSTPLQPNDSKHPYVVSITART
jgi:hypothetical protein